MRLRSILAGVGALAMAASPAVAANPAAPLSVSSTARASADNEGASQLGGGGFAVIALAAVIIAAIALTTTGDDGPDSP